MTECKKPTKSAFFKHSKFNQYVYRNLLPCSDQRLFSNEFPRRLRYLHSISLRTCRNVTDENISLIALRTLTFLDVGYCQLITDAALFCISYGCPSLQTLKLGWCRNITDNGLNLIAERCTLLRFLELKFCVLITDGGMIQIVQKCLQLESLNCCCCREITDMTLYQLSQCSHHLLKLNMGYNSNITSVAIFHLLSDNRQLQALVCIECNQITPEFISDMKQQFPDVEINSAIFI
mmetsp:Transcript_22672/g.31074  ORF Transcript_22672/g.31074 Transcript_22672/m.31074 type:complete len:235 (-) Transcript_22672:266-970(-)